MDWGDNAGKVFEWSEVGRWERWENSEVARSERWECNEVAILKTREGVSREGGRELEDKIVLYCSREAKYKHAFYNTYIIFWIVKVN